MMEVWKDIPNFEGLYQVSTNGHVRCLERLINRRNKFGVVHVLVRPARVLTPKNRAGYLGVQLSEGMGKRKTHLLHRLVLSTFIDNPLNKPQVNHKDGNKHNNRLGNLEWATRSENQLHRYRTLKV